MISAPSVPPSAAPPAPQRAAYLAAQGSTWLRQHLFALLAGGIIGAAVAVRVALLAAGWPGSDSDDATMGIMAKHILLRGEHPIFFYGQAYMGTLEAYLGALFYPFLGVSSFALKCGLVVLYALFMATMYFLVAQAFQPRVALVALLLLAVGADEQLRLQLEAYGGYLETLLFGALLIVTAMWLIRRSDTAPRTGRQWGGFVLWGLIAGVAVWSDPLVAPFVALSFVPLLVMQRRHLRRRVALLAVLGFLVGVLPWLIYIITSPSFSGAKSFLKDAPTHHVGTAVQSSAGQPLIDHLLGMVLISVPNRTGITAVCRDAPTAVWPPEQWTTSGVWGCLGLRALWGTAFIALLIWALTWEGGRLRRQWRRDNAAYSDVERTELARTFGRLMALGAPALSLTLFALSSASSFAPWQSARYLVSLAIALPVMGASLWERLPRVGGRWPRLARAVCIGATGAVLLSGIVGTAATFRLAPATRTQAAQQFGLITTLAGAGQTRVYSDFWTCMRMIFQSNEQIVCSTLHEDFTLAPNRYRPYDALVAAAPNPAYVFPVGSLWAVSFPQYAQKRGWGYIAQTVEGGFVIYTVLR